MSLSDEIKNASDRLAQTLHTAQATMQHLQNLLAMAHQPLPNPPRAPLVGDDKPAPRFEDHVHEVGSCYCDRWPSDKHLCEFIAECGGAASVLDCMVAFGIETHAQAIAMIGEASGRGAIESTTDDIGTVRYRQTDNEPKRGKRAKNEFTAREWRNSLHFLHFMEQTCFATWDATKQSDAGDQFVDHAEVCWPALKMNRWGSRFKSFHGVT